MIYEDMAHHACRHGQKVRAVVPLNGLPVDQADICLVDERRRLKAMPHAFSGHATPRDSVKLLMDERDQSLEGTLVALSPFKE